MNKSRTLFTSMICAISLSGCATADDAPVNEELFEQYQVATGTAEHPTIMAGFFRGGAIAELAVVQVEENNESRLRMYGFDSDGRTRTLVSLIDTTLRRQVQFVDVANIGGRDRLISYETGRVSWLDIDSATEHTLAEVTTHYNAPHANATDAGAVPRLDITRDLNRDGRDDLLLPDLDGFWVSIQKSDGTFTDAMKLGPPEPYLDEAGLDESGTNAERSYRDVGITAFTLPLYSGRVHQMDYDLDGRTDLVFWNTDRFDVHRQNEAGTFSAVAESFTVDVPFDSEGAHSRTFEFSDDGAFSLMLGLRKNTERTVLHSLRDMNGDGHTDLVTMTFTGRSILRQRSRYEVHFGTQTANSIVFTPQPSAIIRSGGKAGAMQPWGYASHEFDDFDGDGRVDVMFKEVSVGVGGMVRALVARSATMNLEFFRAEDGIYPDNPNVSRKIKWDFKRCAFFPAVQMGDMNGDGRADLLVGDSCEEVHVFLGVPGPDLLAEQPQRVAVTRPAGEFTWLTDLNNDGRQDVVMHHHSDTEPNQLTILMARTPTEVSKR